MSSRRFPRNVPDRRLCRAWIGLDALGAVLSSLDGETLLQSNLPRCCEVVNATVDQKRGKLLLLLWSDEFEIAGDDVPEIAISLPVLQGA